MNPEQLAKIRASVESGDSVRTAARAVGVHHTTALRALAKIKDKVRTASEFKGLPDFTPPRRQAPSTCWSLEQIRNARDAQMRGDFKTPVQLAKIMATDDAIFTARRNRAAPQSCLATRLVPANGARGERVAAKAARSVHVSRKVMRTISTCLADHGIAIGYNDHEPSEDGTRVDFRLKSWPLQHVKWNEHLRVLETRVEGGGVVEPIIHGNGKWTIFAGHDEDPWAHDAAILPAAFVWGIHANGLTDWAAGSLSHGQAKIMGELPSGVALVNADGSLTSEAQAFLSMMQQIISGNSPVGIRPANSKTDFLANGSTAWQVFAELIMSREKAAARIYLGTDAILGSVGGAPGVDISALFAMATTIIQGDLEILESCLRTGVYEPWCAINEGDSSYAPTLRYNQPDPDAKAKSEENAGKLERFHAELERLKKNGFIVDQAVVDRVARTVGLDEAPKLAEASKAATTLTLAPTDIARVVRVREARERAAGLPPFGDERDDMTISELEARGQAEAQASTPSPGGPPPKSLTPAALNALAGNFDESKHPRADDGKFGSGPGSGGGGESRGDKPRRSLDEIRKDLDAADEEHDAAELAESEAQDDFDALNDDYESHLEDARADHASALEDAQLDFEDATSETRDTLEAARDELKISEGRPEQDRYDGELEEMQAEVQRAEAEHTKATTKAQAKLDKVKARADAKLEKESAKGRDKVEKAKAELDSAKARSAETKARLDDLQKEKVDADGDGRTGAEEEFDDDQEEGTEGGEEE